MRVTDRRRATVSVHALASVLPLLLVPMAYAELWSFASLVGFVLTDLSILEFVAYFALLAVLHELIHAFAFICAGASPRAISFAVSWRHLTPATFCHQPVSARAFRWVVAAPLIALGLVPSAYGLMTGSAAVTFWSAFMISAAAGDVAILHATRDLPAGHPMWVSARPPPGQLGPPPP